MRRVVVEKGGVVANRCATFPARCAERGYHSLTLPGIAWPMAVPCNARKGRRVRTNYILIDHENVQPKNLGLLNGHPFEVKVIVFVGAKPGKFNPEPVMALQALGDNGQYVQMEGSGTNALDFHIAFYIGQIAERDKDAYFHIISKDKGFDPLIAHLKTKDIYARRSEDLAEIPLLKMANVMSIDEKIALIVERLHSLGDKLPGKIKALANTIDSTFGKTLDAAEVERLIAQLRKRKIVTIKNEKVSYSLPPAIV